MSRRKNVYLAQKFESCVALLPKHKDGTIHKDTSSNIYNSMRFSQAWHNLTYKQRDLYSVMKGLQFSETKHRSELITEKEKSMFVKEELSRINISLRFTFCQPKWCNLYGLYSPNGRKELTKDIQALIDNGFIKIIQNGKNIWGANIYEYSDNWRELGQWQNPYKNE